MWKKLANSFRIAASGTDRLWKTCGKIPGVFHRVFILCEYLPLNQGFFHKISIVADILCNPLHFGSAKSAGGSHPPTPLKKGGRGDGSVRRRLE